MTNAVDLTIEPPSTGAEGDAANLIQSVLRRVGSEGGTVHLSSGTYDIRTFTVIPSGVTVDFQDVSIRMGYSGLFVKTLPGTHDVRLTGKLSFQGNHTESAGIGFFGSTRVSASVEADVNGLGFGRPFFVLDQCLNASVSGTISSRDSRIVSVVDSSGVEICGIRAGPYIADPRDGIVRVFMTGMHGPVGEIHLHDIEVDGGGKLATSGMLGVNPPVGPIRNVRIERCKLRNSSGMVDGVDVNRSIGVTVSDVYAEQVNVGVAVVASSAVVSRIEGNRCRAAAFEYGDPKYQFESISGLAADGIVSHDCGGGWGGVYSAGIGIYQSPGTTTSDIVLRNVDSTDTGSRSQRFGLGIGTGVRNVRVVSGRLGGYAGKVLNLSLPTELSLDGVG